jgi:anti-anti-sigma factor
VRLEGELDLATRDELAGLLACLRLHGCSLVEVDALRVTFVDATCLRVLHDERRRLRAGGGTLRLVAASSFFVKVLDAAGYDDLLPGHAQSHDSLARDRGMADVRPSSGHRKGFTRG